MILNGKVIAKKILGNLAKKIAKMKNKPCLAVILVGHDPASVAYVKIKEQTAKKIGVGFKKIALPANTPQDKIINSINKLNLNPNITGVIVQLPLPKDIDTDEIVNSIDPKKDIDGLNPVNNVMIPPTPAAILEILSYYKISLANKNIVLVGHGRLVGKPMEKILRSRPEKIKLIICNSQTKNLAAITKTADILISAVGVANLITAGMVKKGVVVIDAGTSSLIAKSKELRAKGQNPKRYALSSTHIYGDTDYQNIKKIASYITPPIGW
ncbi:MAG: bifunctional 5,10-methylenetetrahydrofolate dehydrogenase/5,10-methenyltetrahydrofolate cyclohydrolase [Patescibacteria group bacterium]|nr:bifunctional 5,10-methylenetetrahydrofolate dehydrogenase/5,10-methenyltetrahydrofolate cyclohydrolase [Patescibacteria group bacterium]